MRICCECCDLLATATWRHFRTSAGDNISVSGSRPSRAPTYQRRSEDSLYPKPTYQWRCRCGRNWERRHERIATWWAENIGEGRPAGDVTAILGRDL
jgi:hypothetical protein